MAGPGSDPSDDEPKRGGDHTAAFDTFEESPEEEADDASAEAEAEDERPKGLLTVVAIVVSIGLGIAVALLAQSASPADLTTGEILTTTALTALVATAGLIAVRWGWWVTAGVTLAFFGLVMYNLALNQDSTIFGGSDPQDLAYAVLGPGPGVVLGYALQGLYSLIAKE